VNPPTDPIIVYWPLGVYFALAIVVVASMLVLSHLLGECRTGRKNNDPYESGIVSTGTARVRFSADFYLIAILFVVFDLESVFVIAWAAAARELGWAAYIHICIFIGILFASWAYLWRQRALDS